MYLHQGQWHYSPSDLTLFMQSPFASHMQRLAVEQPQWKDKQDSSDAFDAAVSQTRLAARATN